MDVYARMCMCVVGNKKVWIEQMKKKEAEEMMTQSRAFCTRVLGGRGSCWNLLELSRNRSRES